MRNHRGVTGVELLVILAVATLFTTCIVSLNGCTGQPVANQQQLATVGVQLVAFNLGAFVAEKKPAADIPIRDAYLLARNGTLPPEQVATAMSELKMTDPLLAGNCLIVLKAMGASFTPAGQLSGLGGITPETWDAARDGYLQGFAIGAARKS